MIGEMQRWKRMGCIYGGKSIPGFSYASVPVSFFLSDDVIRIYFSSRDADNRSLPFYLDYNLADKTVVNVSQHSLLNLGDAGCFDDSGVMPTCMIRQHDDIWLYYIGWNLGVTVPFRNSLGIAKSSDNGISFEKIFKGPVLDRNKNEPHFNASSHVLLEDNVWKIWYLSCIKWEIEGGRMKHYYHIKYAESTDGINWNRQGKIAIDFKYENEYAISVPRVIKENNLYRMWYSYRGGPYSEKYRIGYAESADGISWKRKDELVQFQNIDSDWDNEMVCYPFPFYYRDELYMLYNGNGYGKSGFGLAKLSVD